MHHEIASTAARSSRRFVARLLAASRFLALATASLLVTACDRVQRQRELESDSPYARQVREAIPRVEKATGLTFKRPPAVTTRSSDEVRAFVMEQFRDSATERQLAAQETIYKRLGAIPERMSLRDLLTDLLEEQVVGYYDPKRDTLYVVKGRDETITGAIITHELIHALQDQYVDIDSIVRQKGNDDRLAAAQSLLEGQATFDGIVAMSGSLISGTTNWSVARDQIRQNRSSTPRMAAAPTIVQEALIFPYLSGAEFVRRQRDRAPTASVLRRFPVSSEQVLHDSAFSASDQPVPVRFTGVSGIGYENTVGEFETRVLLYEQLRDVSGAARAAQGWGGDRIALAAGDVLLWASAWDTQSDAAEFFESVSRMMGIRYEAAAEGQAGATTRVVRAPGRRATVSIGDVGGRPTVLVVDAPEARGAAFSLANVQVGDAGTR